MSKDVTVVIGAGGIVTTIFGARPDRCTPDNYRGQTRCFWLIGPKAITAYTAGEHLSSEIFQITYE